ncbi:hypothetical protein PRK78_004586 [Emydomyces testavorans]|uniref:Uncharacterized protein n=1 Tax=Emydomyces testavorans TaxID=2070801 RepID=A0AAF0DIC0_9EURO|nr:hypothetical protein PRK78_004586 [Emydomyces testavorans]
MTQEEVDASFDAAGATPHTGGNYPPTHELYWGPRGAVTPDIAQKAIDEAFGIDHSIPSDEPLEASKSNAPKKRGPVPQGTLTTEKWGCPNPSCETTSSNKQGMIDHQAEHNHY